jgi:hemerythrin-like domain-containing protein
MTKIIEILREEHRNIEELLLVLEQELNVFDRNEQPDYEILQAVISYFHDYPDCCHHPKEDMIFLKLKARDPVAAGSVGDLEAEHQNEGKRLQRVAQMIRSILTHHEVLRPTFDDIMRDFIEHERKHMEMEERVLFPAAVNALQPEDWAGIDAIWSEKKDTMFNVAFEEKCQSLRDRILQWEREKSGGSWITQRTGSHAKNQH